jgi:hypothetical protein
MEKSGHDEYDDDGNDNHDDGIMKGKMSISLKNLPYHQGMRLV